MSSPKLLLPSEYVHDAAARIMRAQKRVVFLAMVAFDDDTSAEIFNAMATAAKRGVEVDVAADIFTYTEAGETTFPIRYYNRKASRATATRRKLLKSGAKFRWLGRSRMTLFSGRTHSKWCIVDDTVYSFGGVNLFNLGVTNNDLMFRVTDKKIADAIVHEHERIKHADGRDTAHHSYTKQSQFGMLLFDGGLVGESIIYKRATILATQASKVTLVSQYCPTGKLAKVLRNPDKNAELYFNPPANATFTNGLLIRFGMLTSRVSTRYTREQYLHAKFMIFEMPDGSEIAITGSHNFNYTGVLFGTREIALETTNPEIIAELKMFLSRHVK